MKLAINGEEKEFSKEMTVLESLTQEKVKMPDMVSVELNGQILKRSQFESVVLKDGDKVEFLYFMGGGNGIH